MFYTVWGAIFGLTGISVVVDHYSQKTGQLRESLENSSFANFQGENSTEQVELVIS